MDTHTHSVASGHAYSTVDENMRWAAEKGLELVALTDHAPGMKDTTGHAYFANLHVLPKELHGVKLLKGIELNIMDFDGNVDMDEKVLSRLDLGIASLHMPCIKPGSRKENTAALVKVMENPYVDIIGHPGDPRYDVDYKEVFRQAKATGTILEINNASLNPGGFRDGSQENVKAILTEAGATFDNVVKTTVFLKDMNDFAAMNAVYGQYYAENCPARSAVEVGRLPKDVLVEIETIAYV